MYCYQCQEAAKNVACTVVGVCGKKPETSNLLDLLEYIAQGIAVISKAAEKNDPEATRFVINALFASITNANFDDEVITERIKQGITLRDGIREKFAISGTLNEAALWTPANDAEIELKAKEVGAMAVRDEDLRSLRELLLNGLKGACAYVEHAEVLGYIDNDINQKILNLLADTAEDLTADELLAGVLACGELSVGVMALLDKANTETYGNPEITEVNIGVEKNPGILISGHDLKDLEELLEQTKGTGVDVYTHGEMLPAHYYTAFKKYDNLVGNYGGAWFTQKPEFEKFNGPILMTTNCLVPPNDSYKSRLFTTSNVGFPGVKHIEDRKDNGSKDFSEIIEIAKKCDAPEELETGKIVGGFAHAQVTALADKVVSAVKSGDIKRFVVMAGCDGRHKSREYYTEVAQELPKDSIILTAGCAKYRYNKLDLGDIGGIPRVLDAGQCNDSYSLAVIALKLKEIFELEDINELPISFDIAWYEQKAVTVLLALLHLGVKGIRLGPTLPAFISPNVAKILTETFDLKGIGDPKEDVELMMQGK